MSKCTDCGIEEAEGLGELCLSCAADQDELLVDIVKRLKEAEKERDDLHNIISTALHIWESMDEFDDTVIVMDQVIETLRYAKRGVSNAPS